MGLPVIRSLFVNHVMEKILNSLEDFKSSTTETEIDKKNAKSLPIASIITCHWLALTFMLFMGNNVKVPPSEPGVCDPCGSLAPP